MLSLPKHLACVTNRTYALLATRYFTQCFAVQSAVSRSVVLACEHCETLREKLPNIFA